MNTCVWRVSVLILCLISVSPTERKAVSQSTTYSSSPTYRRTLDELSKKDAHPSLMGDLRVTAAMDVVGRDTKQSLDLRSSDWTLTVAKSPFSLEFLNRKTKAAWRIAPGALQWAGADQSASTSVATVAGVRREGPDRVLELGLQGRPDTAQLRISSSSEATVHLHITSPKALEQARLIWSWGASGPFFGLGERFAEEKLDGIQATLKPEDLFGSKGHNWTYINVPLLYTPHGVGLYYDTGEVTQFDLSRASESRFDVRMDRPSTDLYLFAGGGPKEVLQAYTALTGTTPLSPPWAYGVWICAYEGPDLVLQTAQRLRAEHIPASAIWTFDAMGEGDVMGWPLWRTGYYPQTKEMTDKLHQLGFKSLTYVHPYLRNKLAPYNLPNPQYDMAKQNHFMVTNPAGVPTGPRFEPTSDGNIDFTRPAAVDWYQKKIRHILLEDGFDGWMEDYGEWINEDDQFANGVKGRDMQNLNSFLYHKATYQISTEAKPDAVEFVRSGYAGSQAFTRVVWGGDQFPEWAHDAGLPSVIAAGITAGLSGFAVWGPDIEENGFSKELWMRWIEFGALTPIMRDHPWDKPSAAINIWSDKETMAAFKKYAGLHVSLFPYLYTFAHEAERTGLPIMRHPMLEAPQEPAAADADLEYFLGDRLLVAPVAVQNATTRDLYLPKGDWVNFWTGELIRGGRSATLAAPLERIPLLVRAGSVLPFISPDTQTLATDLPKPSGSVVAADRIWRVFPASTTEATTSTFTVYDGARATAVQDDHRIHVVVEHTPAGQTQEVAFLMNAKPSSLKLDGKDVAEQAQASALPGSGSWYFDATEHMVHVFPLASNTDVLITR